MFSDGRLLISEHTVGGLVELKAAAIGITNTLWFYSEFLRQRYFSCVLGADCLVVSTSEKHLFEHTKNGVGEEPCLSDGELELMSALSQLEERRVTRCCGLRILTW